ncbi:hypothetical protein BDZ89DRAFT_1249203 [Hymenopellis radicata]|nr:hypothetical protein BDZ89DRAFT_1249203 [Hymenopellis radicata]
MDLSALLNPAPHLDTARLIPSPSTAYPSSSGGAPSSSSGPKILTPSNLADLFTGNSTPSRVYLDVEATSRTTLSRLYVYDDLDAYVDLPETGFPQPIGYLFHMDPKNWYNPMLDFAYSRGPPSGRTLAGQVDESCTLYIDAQTRLDVPCQERHYTCQGSKLCPMADQNTLCEPHTRATRDDVSARLTVDRESRAASSSPRAAIFRKTAALLAAVRRHGCRAAQDRIVQLPPSEQIAVDFLKAHNERIRRGYKPSIQHCEGRITNRDHFWMVIDCSYDMEYLEAVLEEDDEEITRIESEAESAGYGPLATCSTVVNFSSKRVVCPFDHRDSNGRLYQPEMIHAPCQVKFRMWEPTAEYRSRCPFILVTVRGLHEHPVPLPQKTPPRLRNVLFDLFQKTGSDLADLTARRFLRHPILLSFLKEAFPTATSATLADLHKGFYPFGTGWKGIVRLKALQDEHLPLEERYIRRIIELDPSTGEEYTDGQDHERESLKIVLCMYPTGSQRLLQASFVQSDIAFKRVIGYQEFELAGWESESHQSLTFCRAFVTSETAETHLRLLEEIDSVLEEDCGKRLSFYHLHAATVNSFKEMILLWTGDHHPGQAKGGARLGLFLQKKAWLLPLRRDLCDPSQLVSQLSIYEHLRRLFRACEIHYFRNIRKCPVIEEVRQLMRGLSCLEHADFDGALAKIEQLDWAKNKRDNVFVFPGICWERSAVHREIWMAGPRHTNNVEIAHFDVNEEGRRCTLLSGLEKSRRYDHMKLLTLEIHDVHGVRPSYRAGHPTENAIEALRRKCQSQLV